MHMYHQSGHTPRTPISPLPSQSPSSPFQTPEPQPSTQTILATETWHGIIETHQDAALCVEAVIAGLLSPVSDFAAIRSVTRGTTIRSGSVIVFKETASKQRWRDALNWTSSRIKAGFLTYREVEEIQSSTGQVSMRVMKDGLVKRTVSVRGSDGCRYRVIAYHRPGLYSRWDCLKLETVSQSVHACKVAVDAPPIRRIRSTNASKMQLQFILN
ncbi:Gti1/Pac2 family-domain-containing protein [Chytriomyces cf. hyalinus JEL632]|nr:Gti1/Pac2 family-domain-containing protein [Chytriomyces cf. hyalinus JEL632]